MNSDDRFDLQMPWQPHFFEWEKKISDHGDYVFWHINPNDGNYFVCVTMSKGSMAVRYCRRVDEIIITHRVGGPAKYNYHFRSGRMTDISFFLFDDEYDEHFYWTRMATDTTHYTFKDDGKELFIVGTGKGYPHPIFDASKDDIDIKTIYRLEQRAVKSDWSEWTGQMVTRSKYYKIMEQRFKGFV